MHILGASTIKWSKIRNFYPSTTLFQGGDCRPMNMDPSDSTLSTTPRKSTHPLRLGRISSKLWTLPHYSGKKLSTSSTHLHWASMLQMESNLSRLLVGIFEFLSTSWKIQCQMQTLGFLLKQQIWRITGSIPMHTLVPIPWRQKDLYGVLYIGTSTILNLTYYRFRQGSSRGSTK